MANLDFDRCSVASEPVAGNLGIRLRPPEQLGLVVGELPAEPAKKQRVGNINQKDDAILKDDDQKVKKCPLDGPKRECKHCKNNSHMENPLFNRVCKTKAAVQLSQQQYWPWSRRRGGLPHGQE